MCLCARVRVVGWGGGGSTQFFLWTVGLALHQTMPACRPDSEQSWSLNRKSQLHNMVAIICCSFCRLACQWLSQFTLFFSLFGYGFNVNRSYLIRVAQSSAAVTPEQDKLRQHTQVKVMTRHFQVWRGCTKKQNKKKLKAQEMLKLGRQNFRYW